MDAESLRPLKPELDVFLSRYLSLFGQEGNGGHARTLVQGLLAGGDRRNVENMAEAIAGGVVRTLQKFVAQGGWNGEAVLRELRRHVVEEVGDEDAAILVDETGFPKKGTKDLVRNNFPESNRGGTGTCSGAASPAPCLRVSV